MSVSLALPGAEAVRMGAVLRQARGPGTHAGDRLPAEDRHPLPVYRCVLEHRPLPGQYFVLLFML